MSNPFKKIKRAVKKGTKKIKKGLGSLANKVADKLVPKELAPFLPALAPLFMGPNASLLMRYLTPQLLTALSSGKTKGDIDLTSQALTGIASALSDPRRFELATPTEAQAAVEGIDPNAMIPGSEQIGFGKFDPATDSFIYDGGDLLLGPEGTPLTLGDLPANTFDPSTGQLIQNVPGVGGMPPNVVVVPGSGTSVVGYGQGQIDPAFAQAIGSGSPAVSAQPLTSFDKGLNALKTGANKTLDFMQGLNEATKFGEPILDDAGNPVLVRDAGFFQNLPRKAIQQGILSAGPIMASIEKSEEEQAAMLAEQQAEQQAALDARDALTDFYFGLSDPQNKFGTLPIFAAEGGTINSKRGLVDGPGGYAGHDDIDDIIRKLIEDMAIDFSKAGGGNPPSIVGGTDFKKRKLPKGMEVIRSIKPKKAEGGIMNTAPGMPQGMQVDGRNGTFIPMGVEEKADDVPAMLSKNEFVMTADAVKAAGGGSVEKGAQRMYDLMNSLEARV